MNTDNRSLPGKTRESPELTDSVSVLSQSWNEVRRRRRTPGVCWTAAEDRLLMEGVRLYGSSSWVAISGYVGTRTRKQCRERYVNILSRNPCTLPWTPEEDNAVMRGYHTHGRRWSEISREMVSRTPREVRNRYFSIVTRYQHSCGRCFVPSTCVYEVVTGSVNTKWW